MQVHHTTCKNIYIICKVCTKHHERKQNIGDGQSVFVGHIQNMKHHASNVDDRMLKEC